MRLSSVSMSPTYGFFASSALAGQRGGGAGLATRAGFADAAGATEAHSNAA